MYTSGYRRCTFKSESQFNKEADRERNKLVKVRALNTATKRADESGVSSLSDGSLDLLLLSLIC